MNIAIIGGGVSGMIAAITAAKCGSQVTIFEHMPRIGKKLLFTGNGRCNISNVDMDSVHFHGGDHEKIEAILSACPQEETLKFFEELGLYIIEKNGYMYPFCEQASAVLDVLRFAIRDMGIDVFTDTNIKLIEMQKMFIITTERGQLEFERLILCCGSSANRNTGSDGSGYNIATKLGHNIIKPLPALTSLVCDDEFFPSLSGIRTMATVSLFSIDDKEDSKILGKEYGQLQFTKSGISGICVFNLSHMAVKSIDLERPVKAMIDLLPDISWGQIGTFIRERISRMESRPAEEFFAGLLAKPLGICICKRCAIDLKRQCGSISDEEITDLCKMIKEFEANVVSSGDFETAQVCQGGVDLDEISETLESKIVPGLCFAGEILDVNGDCGGYNLQWAASSGILAGKGASR